MAYVKRNKELEDFCAEHEIKKLGAEYFFTINERNYKISRFKVEESKIKDVVLPRLMSSRTRPKLPIQIYGMSKDVIRIYNDLLNGIELDFATGRPVAEIIEVPAEEEKEANLSKAEPIPPVKQEAPKPVIRHTKSSTVKKQEALNQLFKRR